MAKKELTQEELEARYKEKLQWFIDRVGKRVWRDPLSCGCSGCKEAEENGIIISCKNHAAYLNDCSSEMGYKYRDEK